MGTETSAANCISRGQENIPGFTHQGDILSTDLPDLSCGSRPLNEWPPISSPLFSANSNPTLIASYCTDTIDSIDVTSTENMLKDITNISTSTPRSVTPNDTYATFSCTSMINHSAHNPYRERAEYYLVSPKPPAATFCSDAESYLKRLGYVVLGCHKPETQPRKTPSHSTQPIQITISPEQVSASAIRHPMGKMTYWPNNVLKTDNQAAWCAPGYGINSSITLSFDAPHTVDSILLTNGYSKSQPLFRLNYQPRVLSVKLSFEDGSSESFLYETKNKYNESLSLIQKPETIPVPAELRGRKATAVTITIHEMHEKVSVPKGSNNQPDTCISQIQVRGE